MHFSPQGPRRTRSPHRLAPVRATLAGLALAVTALAGCARPPASAAEPVRWCLAGGQVVDPAHETITAATVQIDGERVARLLPPGASCEGPSVAVPGAFLLPGLVDLHVHGWRNRSPSSGDEILGHERAASQALAAGVVLLLDLGEHPDDLAAARERLRGSREHARYLVGARVTVERRSTADPAEAASRVEAIVRRTRPDFLKVIDRGGRVLPYVAAARALGLRSVVHVETWDSALRAARAGAAAITHLDDAAVVPAEVVTAMAAHGSVSIPTLAVQCDLARIARDPTLLDDPLLARLAGERLLRAYRQPETWSDEARTRRAWQERTCAGNDFPSVQRLRAGGVTLLAGSDSGDLGTFQGWSLHRELELLVEAGLTPWQALRAGSVDAARFLGIPWGIEPGREASLIVLVASPVADIRNTRHIRATVFRGRMPPALAGGAPAAPSR